MDYSQFMEIVSKALETIGIPHCPDWFGNRASVPKIGFVKHGDCTSITFGSPPADRSISEFKDLPLRRFSAITICLTDGRSYWCDVAIGVTLDSNNKVVDIRPRLLDGGEYRVLIKDWIGRVKELRDSDPKGYWETH